MKIPRRRHQWAYASLFAMATKWCMRTRKRVGAAGERSSWWILIAEWPKRIETWLREFIAGNYQFSPMMQYDFGDEAVRVWSYRDRLMIHLLLNIIRPTFRHIISSRCLHLRGPSAVKEATEQIKKALDSGYFNYVFRIDIRSFYASIDHRLLLEQVYQHFDDPIIRKYLHDIITIGIDWGGEVLLPTQGLPKGSGLSPLLGALYLSALEKAFDKIKDVFYLRYMDDIIILTPTKRKYVKAKKRLFEVLRQLKLRVAPHKTRMGVLGKGFHFLGVDFEVSQNPQSKIQELTVKLHTRTYRRALDKITALRANAVHPATIQCYLIGWATWWQRAIGPREIGIVRGVSGWVSGLRQCWAGP